MSEYDPQYLITVEHSNDLPYIVGPFLTADETVNWIYNQIGSIKLASPELNLVKHKWIHQEDESRFYPSKLEVIIEIGEYKISTATMSNPKIIRIHPECKEIKKFQFTDITDNEPF